MRTSTIYFLIICCLFSCNQPPIVKETGNTIVKNLYPNGIIKEIISLNKDSVRNGESFYFDENGKMDSSVTFLNGKYNGIKNKYFSEYGIYEYDYINDTAVSKKIYDTLGVLVSIEPLDISKFPPLIAVLSNNKNYVVRNETDTLLLQNDYDIPAFNTAITSIGATFKRLKSNGNDLVFTTSRCSKMGSVTIMFSLYSNIDDEKNNNSLRRDTVSFPIKEL
jgi:hypothetical protein